MKIALRGDADFEVTRRFIMKAFVELWGYNTGFVYKTLDKAKREKYLSVTKLLALAELLMRHEDTPEIQVKPLTKKAPFSSVIIPESSVQHSFDWVCSNTLNDLLIADEVDEQYKDYGPDENDTVLDTDLIGYEGNNYIYTMEGKRWDEHRNNWV